MPRVNRELVLDVLRMGERMPRDEEDVVERERDVGANSRAAVRTRVVETRRPAVRLGRSERAVNWIESRLPWRNVDARTKSCPAH